MHPYTKYHEYWFDDGARSEVWVELCSYKIVEWSRLPYSSRIDSIYTVRINLITYDNW